MKVNFNLKNPKGTDKTPIFVTVVYKTKRVRVQTNKSIKPGEWNKDEQKARQVLSGYSSFNKWLKDIDAYVSQIEILFWVPLVYPFLNVLLCRFSYDTKRFHNNPKRIFFDCPLVPVYLLWINKPLIFLLIAQ